MSDAVRVSDWLKWVLLGALLIVFGVLALNNAVLASFSVTLVIGALFVAGGIVQIVAGFREAGRWSRITAIGLGALMTVLGALFLVDPFAGTISLALTATVFIGAGGLLRLYYARETRGSPFFWPMLISGAASVVLAVFIFFNPQLTLALLGVLLGLDLVFTGAALVALGLHRRRGGPTGRAAA